MSSYIWIKEGGRKKQREKEQRSKIERERKCMSVRARERIPLGGLTCEIRHEIVFQFAIPLINVS